VIGLALEVGKFIPCGSYGHSLRNYKSELWLNLCNALSRLSEWMGCSHLSSGACLGSMLRNLLNNHNVDFC
jgi:hypothetical protein